MSNEGLVAVSVFILYFVVIFSLFVLILGSIIGQNKKIEVKYGLLGLAALTHTWYWMIKYMSWSFHNFEAQSVQGEDKAKLLDRVGAWLINTSLFEEAWWTVCGKAMNWWWSEQLCLFTAGFFTIFLHQQNIRHRWAYMLLGQMVAISVAWSLILLASSSTANGPTNRRLLSLTAVLPITLSFLCILLVPHTVTFGYGSFLTNLTVMHALLFVPLLPVGYLGPNIGTTPFCTFLATLGLIMRVRTTMRGLAFLGITNNPFFDMANYPFDTLVLLWHSPSKIVEAAWNVLHSHPAQASIGWDIVYTSIIWFVWSSSQQEGLGPRHLLGKTLRLAVTSVGVAAPIEVRMENSVHDSLKIA